MVPNRQFSLMRTVGKAVVFVTFLGIPVSASANFKISIFDPHNIFWIFFVFTIKKCGSDAEGITGFLQDFSAGGFWYSFEKLEN